MLCRQSEAIRTLYTDMSVDSCKVLVLGDLSYPSAPRQSSLGMIELINACQRLGASCTAVTYVGADELGAAVIAELAAMQTTTDIIQLQDWQTVTEERLAGLDRDATDQLGIPFSTRGECLAHLTNRAEKHLTDADLLIVVDEGRGAVSGTEALGFLASRAGASSLVVRRVFASDEAAKEYLRVDKVLPSIQSAAIMTWLTQMLGPLQERA